MKKWWKIILGILLIAAAACAMYYWNAQGRRQLEAAKAQAVDNTEIEIIKDPKSEMYEKGYSYFPIPTNWIAVKSIKLAAGDWVGIYFKYPEYENQEFIDELIESENDDEYVYENDFYDNGYEKYDLERIGAYEVSYIDENIVEIICNVDDFKNLENKLAGDYGKLFMVMEAKSE